MKHYLHRIYESINIASPSDIYQIMRKLLKLILLHHFLSFFSAYIHIWNGQLFIIQNSRSFYVKQLVLYEKKKAHVVMLACVVVVIIHKLKCYKNEHSLEICHWAWSSKLSCKILLRYDQPFSRKWCLKLLFLVVFRIFPNWNCHFRPGLWKARCDVVRLYVLQSTVLVLFVSIKTEARRSFG